MYCGGRPSSSDTAKLLAIASAQSERKIVLCDTTGQSEKEFKDKASQNISDLPIKNITNNIDIISGADGSSFFISKDFSANIKNLTNRFDQVFLCSSGRNAYSGLMALSEFSPGLVLI